MMNGPLSIEEQQDGRELKVKLVDLAREDNPEFAAALVAYADPRIIVAALFVAVAELADKPSF